MRKSLRVSKLVSSDILMATMKLINKDAVLRINGASINVNSG